MLAVVIEDAARSFLLDDASSIEDQGTICDTIRIMREIDEGMDEFGGATDKQSASKADSD